MKYTIIDSTDGKFKGHQIDTSSIKMGERLILDEDEGTHFELLISMISVTYEGLIVGNSNYIIKLI